MKKNKLLNKITRRLRDAAKRNEALSKPNITIAGMPTNEKVQAYTSGTAFGFYQSILFVKKAFKESK